jgi:hypothetical protein
MDIARLNQLLDLYNRGVIDADELRALKAPASVSVHAPPPAPPAAEAVWDEPEATDPGVATAPGAAPRGPRATGAARAAAAP